MRPHELDAVLEQWARWIRADGYGGSSFGSMLEMMMITGCMFSGGGRGQALWTVEADVEAAVMALAAADRNAATVIRIEYGAWDLGGLDKKARQIDKAHALFISLSTYKRCLAKGRGFIAAWLSKQRGNDGKAPHC
ncbi:Uncharacterised protein [Serratia ficaria]|uniref:hypothetical protein n=1 Tax=Serratia ficaria TaxID=61651 RepID=UPI002179C85B|nr:hypothetical protein [Serratia ficaria]CAI2030352.1 Uncharacterised protein [Serratia ficaria]CAI2528419.1 Uncharacterised protein [Serratia ficaria]CAI2540249.1 Uncharacterised protein [Serratia ficaria]CAI2794185.1 Uncharacterised protein [Serratia ficaria]